MRKYVLNKQTKVEWKTICQTKIWDDFNYKQKRYWTLPVCLWKDILVCRSSAQSYCFHFHFYLLQLPNLSPIFYHQTRTETKNSSQFLNYVCIGNDFRYLQSEGKQREMLFKFDFNILKAPVFKVGINKLKLLMSVIN